MRVIEKGEDYKISASNGRYLIVEFSFHNYNFIDREKIVVYGEYRDPNRLDATVAYYRKRVEAIRDAIANGWVPRDAECRREVVDLTPGNVAIKGKD